MLPLREASLGGNDKLLVTVSLDGDVDTIEGDSPTVRGQEDEEADDRDMLNAINSPIVDDEASQQLQAEDSDHNLLSNSSVAPRPASEAVLPSISPDVTVSQSVEVLRPTHHQLPIGRTLGSEEFGPCSAESVTNSKSPALTSLWGKASGAASSLFAAASQVTREPPRLRDLGAKLTEFINVPDEEELGRTPPGTMMGDFGIMTEPPTKAPEAPAAAELPTPAVTSDLEGIDDRLHQQMEVINRLHGQMMQTEEALSQARDNELALTEEVQRLNQVLKAREAEVKALEREINSATERVARQVTVELQQELEASSKENEKRLADLRKALKEAQNQLDTQAQQAADRASVDQSLKLEGEKVKKVVAEIAAERDELQATLEEVETRYSADLERWQADLAIATRSQQEAQQLKELAENAKAAVEVELQKVSAQNATLRARVSAMETLGRDLGVTTDPSEMWRKAQSEVLGLRDKARDAESCLQSTRAEFKALQRQYQELQTTTMQLREALAAASLSTQAGQTYIQDSSTSTTSAIPTEDQRSTIAVLEARLAAKSERVEALVCELAALRAQQLNTNQQRSTGVLYSDEGDVMSWLDGFLLRILHAGVADAISRRLRKIGARARKNAIYQWIDWRLRFVSESLARAASSRALAFFYLLLIHVVLLRSLFVGAWKAPSSSVVDPSLSS